MYRYLIILLAISFAANASEAREKRHAKAQHEVSPSERRDSRDRNRVFSIACAASALNGSASRAPWTQLERIWMERVRYYHGEIFLDLSNAADFAKRCGRVSIGEVAGQVLYRCEIEARPCKASFETLEDQK